MKNTITYRLVELGGDCYDFSMEPVTIQFKSKAQAKLFWENLGKATGSLLTAQPTKSIKK